MSFVAFLFSRSSTWLWAKMVISNQGQTLYESNPTIFNFFQRRAKISCICVHHNIKNANQMTTFVMTIEPTIGICKHDLRAEF